MHSTDTPHPESAGVGVGVESFAGANRGGQAHSACNDSGAPGRLCGGAGGSGGGGEPPLHCGAVRRKVSTGVCPLATRISIFYKPHMVCLNVAQHADFFLGSPTAMADVETEKRIRSAAAAAGLHGCYIPR